MSVIHINTAKTDVRETVLNVLKEVDAGDIDEVIIFTQRTDHTSLITKSGGPDRYKTAGVLLEMANRVLEAD